MSWAGPPRGTVLLEKVDTVCQARSRVRIQINGILRPAGNVIDEVSVAATEIQHGGVGADETHEERVD
jgi:hypothetical protein